MNADNVVTLTKTQLRREEQFRAKMCKDSEGLNTIGYGWCLDKNQIRQTESAFRGVLDITIVGGQAVGLAIAAAAPIEQ
jgi:hypothetical protein